MNLHEEESLRHHNNNNNNNDISIESLNCSNSNNSSRNNHSSNNITAMEGHESDNSNAGSLVMSGPEMSDEDDDSRLSNNSRGDPPLKSSSIDPEVFARLKAEVASCAFPQKNFRSNSSFSPFIQHGMPFGQEELERSLPFFFPSPHLMASHLAAAAAAAKGKDIDRDRDREDSPPLHGYPEETLPANNAPHSDSSTSSTSSQQTWSFEEQFKQLYELSDDMKRKEFLDELFSFMQKRGTPINRLPIMAKQVLDLFELYNLVIARGGLVDVINKKLWQEIIKGLHLPSSITSAAFTLRTQYMKYLYPYECEKKRLSTPSELQAAIDGNRREGRRASYGPYPDMISPMSLVGGDGRGNNGGRPQMNGNGNSHPLHSSMKFENPNSPPSSNAASNARDALAALELSRLTLWNLYGGGPPPHQPEIPPLQNEALNLEVPARSSSEGAPTPKFHSSHHRDSTSPKSNKTMSFTQSEKENGKREHSGTNGPASKRHAIEDPESSPSPVSRHIQGTHIKINSRGDGRGVDTSLVVSMEINGIMYQGVLFAQNAATTRVS